jgi:hypothetical protein
LAIPANWRVAFAQDATWTGNATGPFGSDWSTGGNWSSDTVPTGIATFSGSAATTVIDISSPISVNQIFFASTAGSYTVRVGDISNGSEELRVLGASVVNFSDETQLFINKSSIVFQNSSNVGEISISNLENIELSFLNNSSAGNVSIANDGGNIAFYDNSSAGGATIANNGTSLGSMTFFGNSTAGNATIVNESFFLSRKMALPATRL